MSDFHNTGFDPYEQLCKITQALEVLIKAHNNLALEHEELKLVCKQMAGKLDLLTIGRPQR